MESGNEFFRQIRQEMKESTEEMLNKGEKTPENNGEKCESSRSSSSDKGTENKEEARKCIFVTPDAENPNELNVAGSDLAVKELKLEIVQIIKQIKPKIEKTLQKCEDLNNIEQKPSSSSSSSSTTKEAINKLPQEITRYSLGDAPLPPIIGPPISKISTNDGSKRIFEHHKTAIKFKIGEIKTKLDKLSIRKTSNGAIPKTNMTNNVHRSGSNSSISTMSTASKTDSRKKRGKRGQGAAVEQEIPNLNKENYLILTLLTLNSKEREDYLLKIGKERSLLVDSKEKKFVINPRFANYADLCRKKSLLHTYGPSAYSKLQKCDSEGKVSVLDNPEIRPFIPAPKEGTSIKTKPPKSFEDEVTCLLNEIKSMDLSKINPDLVLVNISKAEKNSFSNPENVAELEKFVKKLVEDEVGYLIEGEVRINAKNNTQSFVADSSRNVDAYINSVLLRKCALQGDVVRVFVKNACNLNDTLTSGSEPEMKEKQQKNNQGFVVEILKKKHDRKCIGSFMSYLKDAKHINFVPRDTKIPVLKIYRQNWPEAIFKNNFHEIENILYLAEILEWNDDKPIGGIIKSVGKSGELEAENVAILIENKLDITPYTEAIITKLPPSPYEIPKKEYESREDLRSECVFTIDPLTARDLDDALSCKMLKNGNYEIGVHISDVTYFLQESSELDEIVKWKATTIYMVDNVYHMLPKPLCFLCSLLPGEDKLAFSVFWEMTPDAHIVKTRFARTIINSCTQFAYEHAQTMLENPNKNHNPEDFPAIMHEYTPNYICRIINQLQMVAVQLRKQRMEKGCLKINQPKLSFTLDPKTGIPTAYSVYELNESNRLIEDFMLLANSSIADFIYTKYPDISILRSHFPPTEKSMQELKASLEKQGHKLDIESSKAIYESIECIIETSENPDATRAALNVLAAKPMTRARYFCSENAKDVEDFEHFALAIQIYTHFTSPIRRYADVMVHRVLAAALNYTPKPMRPTEELHQLATNCNIQKYNAKLAGDDSSNLYFLHYVKAQKKISTKASILGIFQHNLEIVLIETGHVLKCMFKEVSKVSTFKFVEADEKPIKHCLIIPEDTSIPPMQLKLFSMLDVVVEFKKNSLKVISVLPVA